MTNIQFNIARKEFWNSFFRQTLPMMVNWKSSEWLVTCVSFVTFGCRRLSPSSWVQFQDTQVLKSNLWKIGEFLLFQRQSTLPMMVKAKNRIRHFVSFRYRVSGSRPWFKTIENSDFRVVSEVPKAYLLPILTTELC